MTYRSCLVRPFCSLICAILLAAGCAIVPGSGESASDASIAAAAPTGGPATSPSPCDLTNVWETDSGSQLRLSELRGRPLVIAMFCASAAHSTIDMLQGLREFDETLPAAVRERMGFVLVTLDPERDSGSVLAAYRSAHHLAPARWSLLRGSPEATRALAAALCTQFFRDVHGEILHSNEIAVFDGNGKLIDRQSGPHPDLSRTIAALKATTATTPTEVTPPVQTPEPAHEAMANVPMKL